MICYAAFKFNQEEIDMKYVHISQQVSLGMKIGSPSTFNIGRNLKKRDLRDGKPRKHWRTLARDYGYVV